MPKPSRRRREIKAPPEFLAAAEVSLDNNMMPKEATDTLRYLMYVRAIERANGNESKAATSLGMTRSAMSQNIALLETRLT